VRFSGSATGIAGDDNRWAYDDFARLCPNNLTVVKSSKKIGAMRITSAPGNLARLREMRSIIARSTSLPFDAKGDCARRMRFAASYAIFISQISSVLVPTFARSKLGRQWRCDLAEMFSGPPRDRDRLQQILIWDWAHFTALIAAAAAIS